MTFRFFKDKNGVTYAIFSVTGRHIVTRNVVLEDWERFRATVGDAGNIGFIEASSLETLEEEENERDHTDGATASGAGLDPDTR